ncbi:MAG: hypothetical protein KKB51_00205 [Candidatus Riflebacteria bacterium]|nr:hypothetical protein [Candidatus Riflebacteria bacterium]
MRFGTIAVLISFLLCLTNLSGQDIITKTQFYELEAETENSVIQNMLASVSAKVEGKILGLTGPGTVDEITQKNAHLVQIILPIKLIKLIKLTSSKELSPKAAVFNIKIIGPDKSGTYAALMRFYYYEYEKKRYATRSTHKFTGKKIENPVDLEAIEKYITNAVYRYPFKH